MVTGDRDHAYFFGNVKGVRDAAKGEANDGPVEMTSEYLHVLPKEDRVVTDKAVTIKDPRGRINAIGMEFGNRSKQDKVGPQVHRQLQTHHEPVAHPMNPSFSRALHPLMQR